MAAAMFVSMMFASCSKDEGISPVENQPPSVEKRSDVQSRSFVKQDLQMQQLNLAVPSNTIL